MKRISGLKLLLFVAAIFLSVLGYLFLSSLLRNVVWGSMLAAAFLAVSCLAANAGFFRSEDRSIREIGFDDRISRIGQLGVGFLAGGSLVAAWSIIVVVVGSARWQFHSGLNVTAATILVVFYLFNNLGEELAYRGYAFLRLEERFGRGITIVATSLVFALMHFQGGMPLLSVLVGVLSNGLIFGVLFSRWKSLPLVLGFHVGTNIFQDVFGLRNTALSFFEFKTIDTTGGRDLDILIAVGCLNFLVALCLYRPFLKSRQGRTEAGR
jgi:membrane protease YdiL (CAAX protease family)